MKTWIINQMFTQGDQIANVQPTPEFDGIEVWFTEANGKQSSGILYLSKEEAKVFTERILDVVEHVKTQK